jgi:uncharacterized protein
MGDDGWRNQPKRMPTGTARLIAQRLAEAYQKQNKPFSVVLHGGEPLLLGPSRLEEICRALREALPNPCGIHLQTNGVLLTDDVIDILVRYDVGISISIDGPATVHDRNRIDHQGKGSHARLTKAIARLNGRADAIPLFAGVLAVIDPSSEPEEVYRSLKATGAPSLDFLVRDGNWDYLPPGKSSPESTEFGEWLTKLLSIYLADPNPPRVRLLDDMLRLILGGTAQKEGVGTTEYGIIVIEPDGRIDKNDTLKVAHAAADRFEKTWNVADHSLLEVMADPLFAEYCDQQVPTNDVCRACPYFAVCGGGMVAHRWSDANRFDNPTIFCADQQYLIQAMESAFARLQAA